LDLLLTDKEPAKWCRLQ